MKCVVGLFEFDGFDLGFGNVEFDQAVFRFFEDVSSEDNPAVPGGQFERGSAFAREWSKNAEASVAG